MRVTAAHKDVNGRRGHGHHRRRTRAAYIRALASGDEGEIFKNPNCIMLALNLMHQRSQQPPANGRPSAGPSGGGVAGWQCNLPGPGGWLVWFCDGARCVGRHGHFSRRKQASNEIGYFRHLHCFRRSHLDAARSTWMGRTGLSAVARLQSRHRTRVPTAQSVWLPQTAVTHAHCAPCALIGLLGARWQVEGVGSGR